MSIQALTWAIEDAPDVPPHLVSSLIALANHADRNGRGAYPSQETVADYTRKSPRQAKRDLDDLQSRGLIRPGDQRFVAHVRPDRRPIVWDLAIELVKPRGDTHVTSTNGHGVTPVTARGDIQGQHGVTPTSPEPKEEPTPEPQANLDTDVSTNAAASGELMLPGLPAAPSKARGKAKPRSKPRLDEPNAQQVTAAWVDAYRTVTGSQPTRSKIGQASRTAKELLDAGNPVDRVLIAARAAAGRGLATIDRELADLTTRSPRTARNGHTAYRDTGSDLDYEGPLR